MNWDRVRGLVLEGKPVVLIDNRREFEADLIYPAEIASPEIVNFMLSMKGLLCLDGHGRGVEEGLLPASQQGRRDELLGSR